MKIHFATCGGWLPMRACDIDTTTLPVAEGRHLEELVLQSDILGHTESDVSSEVRDGDEYNIEIESGTRSYSWQWFGIGKPDGPPALVELLDLLSSRSSPVMEADNEASE